MEFISTLEKVFVPGRFMKFDGMPKMRAMSSTASLRLSRNCALSFSTLVGTYFAPPLMMAVRCDRIQPR